MRITKFLLVLMLAVSGNAMSEWDQIGSNENATVYIDRKTIRKSGDNIEIWTLLDFKVNPRPAFWSGMMQLEFNCRKNLARVLYLETYSEKMGRGTAMTSWDSPNEEWQPIVLGTLHNDVFESICT